MKLIIRASESLPNFAVARRAFESYPGEEVVELTSEAGLIQLLWRSHYNGDKMTLNRMAIPLRWMKDPTRASHVEQATLRFAEKVADAVADHARKN